MFLEHAGSTQWIRKEIGHWGVRYPVFTDAKGKPVAKGNYKVFVEATLYGASSITYSGSFSTQDKAGNIALTSQLTEPDEKHKDMVSGVRAKLY